MKPVRVRFAPSPTGNVHIGNIRVAIFNWLYARHTGGAFLLRVEDTDHERSTPEAVQAIMDALDWLGLAADEAPVFQSTRMDAHLEAAQRLVDAGLAYRADKGNTGREAVLFRMPGEDCSFTDAVKGNLRKAGANMEDFVIVRGNGTPVFHLANVVDDIAMGVTHIIRGDDHVENTFRHLALYEGLGAAVPTYAHLPMIVNQQGKPYSKRDGAAYVGDFRDQGYEADAFMNYLALLGWSPGDDREVMTRAEMVAAFDFSGVNTSAAQMDLRKMEWMNGEYLRALPRETFLERFRASLEDGGLPMSEWSETYLGAVADHMQERTRVWSEVPADAGFFFTEAFAFDEKAVRKRLAKPGNDDLLRTTREAFAALAEWTAASTETAVREISEAAGASAGQYIHPVRVAVSGLMKGPGLFEMLEVLGQERVLARMDAALERFFGDNKEA